MDIPEPLASSVNAQFTVYECHCEGDIERVVVDGLPDTPAGSMYEKMAHLREHHDDLRRFFLNEPRGAVTHSVNYIVPSDHPNADGGYVICESEQYPEMSGGNTMTVATVLLKSGAIPIAGDRTRFTLESPAGLIGLDVDTRDGRIGAVTITNQPAFVYELGATVDVEGFGPVTVDVAYGGMTYAVVDAAALGLPLTPEAGADLVVAGERIKAAAADAIPVTHPENPDLPGITQTLFAGPLEPTADGLRSRNAVIVSPGRIDRCPCGTGTSARLAILHARGELGVGDPFIHESIIGTEFASEIVDTTTVDPYPAVVPTLSGRAWVTGVGTWIREADDPLPTGYRITDTWPSA